MSSDLFGSVVDLEKVKMEANANVISMHDFKNKAQNKPYKDYLKLLDVHQIIDEIRHTKAKINKEHELCLKLADKVDLIFNELGSRTESPALAKHLLKMQDVINQKIKNLKDQL